MRVTVQDIARMCHQLNKAYCLAICDNSQVDWDQAPSAIRASVIHGVELHLKNPGTTPEESHKEWVRYKLSEGWVWGPNKDLQKKEHPNIVPYDKLPERERFKDVLFKTVVDEMRQYLNPDYAAEHFEDKINEQGEGNSRTGEETMNQEEQNERPAAEQQDVKEYQGDTVADTPGTPDASDASEAENAPQVNEA